MGHFLRIWRSSGSTTAEAELAEFAAAQVGGVPRATRSGGKSRSTKILVPRGVEIVGQLLGAALGRVLRQFYRTGSISEGSVLGLKLLGRALARKTWPTGTSINVARIHLNARASAKPRGRPNQDRWIGQIARAVATVPPNRKIPEIEPGTVQCIGERPALCFVPRSGPWTG